MMPRLLLLVLLCVLGVGSAAHAATYYVDDLSTDCADTGGSGTLGDPWRNLYNVLWTRSFTAGDILLLRAGTYRNAYAGFGANCEYDGSYNAVAAIKSAGSSGNPFIIQNYLGEAVVIDGTDADINTGSAWTSCGGGAYSASWLTTSQRTGQAWYGSGLGATAIGTRLVWDGTTTCASVAAGKFSIGSGGTGLYVHLPGDADPDTVTMVVSGEGGDAALDPLVFTTGAAYVDVRVNPSGGSFTVRAGRTNVMVKDGANNIGIKGYSYTGDGAYTAGEFNIVMCGTRDYGSCVRVHNGNNVTIEYAFTSDAMGEVVQIYGGGPGGALPGINISNVTVRHIEAYRGGLAWADGGYLGNNLGYVYIIKNCSTCSLSDAIGRTSYGPCVAISTSTDVGTSNGVTLDQVELSDCAYQNNAAGNRTRAGIQIEPQRSEGSGAVRNVTITNTFIYSGAYCDGTTYSTSHCASSDSIYGITMDDATHTSSTGIKIINNTIRDMQGAGIYADSQTAAFTLRNTIFDKVSTAGSTCPGSDRCDIAVRSGNTTSNNTYWATNSGDRVIYVNGGTTYTRATATSFEASAVQSDPLLTSDTNLHLQAGSPMIGAATSTDAPTTDIDSGARPFDVTYDIGADEYGVGGGGGGPPTTPSVPIHVRLAAPAAPFQLRWDQFTSDTVTGFRVCLDGLTGTSCTDVGLPTSGGASDTYAGYTTYTTTIPSMATGSHTLKVSAYNGSSLSVESSPPLVVTVIWRAP